MGTEAAAMAKEAENANEIIHYFAQEWAPGVVIHMQTMYMTWIYNGDRVSTVLYCF